MNNTKARRQAAKTPKAQILWETVIDALPKYNDNDPDPLLRALIFHARSGWTWYVASASRDTRGISKFDDDVICWGFVQGDEDAWGPFSLREIQEATRGEVIVLQGFEFPPCREADLL